MTVKAVIFDMDGVIFDTERVYMNIWKDVYKRHGLKITEEFYVSLIGRDRNSIIGILHDKFGQELDTTMMFAECDEELKKAILRGEVPVKKGAIELFDYLKEKKIKMALATSSSKEKLEMQLMIQDLKEIFDVIVCADDVRTSKPNPEIFLVSAKKLGMNTDSCVVIEDSPAGIQAAYNAGIRSIHVEDLKKADDLIIDLSERQFKSLVEVKGYLKDLI